MDGAEFRSSAWGPQPRSGRDRLSHVRQSRQIGEHLGRRPGTWWCCVGWHQCNLGAPVEQTSGQGGDGWDICFNPRVPARGLVAAGLRPPQPGAGGGEDRRRRAARDAALRQGGSTALRVHAGGGGNRQVRGQRLPRPEDHLRQRDGPDLRCLGHRRRRDHGDLPRRHQAQRFARLPPARFRLRRRLLHRGRARSPSPPGAPRLRPVLEAVLSSHGSRFGAPWMP